MNTTLEKPEVSIDPRTALRDWRARHEITVEFHQAGIDFSGDHVQFRYRAAVSRAGKTEYFDYSGGTAAFLPSGYRERLSSGLKANWNRAKDAELKILSGRKMILEDKDVQAAYRALYNASKPDAESLIDCLKMDASAIGEDFPEWCDNFGYDQDSRKAERTWQECRENGRRLRALVGNAAWQELLELESL